MDGQSTLGFTLTLLAVALYGVLHSWLASDGAKATSRRLFGATSDRWYRLAFNLLGAITFVPVLVVVALFPGSNLYQIHFPWLLLSAAIQLSAVLLLLAALARTDGMRFLGLRQLTQERLPQAEMTVSGPYRWVRHPLYTAGLLFIWAVPVMTSSILALNLALSLYLFIGSEFEERKLLSQWGDKYDHYRQRVPRMIPRPWKRYPRSTEPINPAA